ncbi:MAG: ATP-dependent zinc metalloprotease FtsH [Bacillota bacterium]|nr:ATP-dependent metallopeptidase FtsH/Yme1/Tma family protein [Candidatus Fermentithermobacillaceae bacterium]HOP70941.1 ATP-dependent zinc metalloprotease FtsH [Bacillota bacterium]HPT36006.1 ATP-dependent zinc metalloprotease FtsH [Bacillota bacterium]
MNGRIWRSLAIYVLLMFVAISLVDLFAPKDQFTDMDFNQFLSLVEKGEISSITITDQKAATGAAVGTLKDGTKFKTVIPIDPELYQYLVASGVVVELRLPQEPSLWVSLLTNMLPALLMVGIFFYMIQQTQGGGKQVMQFGRSRAKLQTDSHQRVTFADVAGCEEAKEELQEIVDFLKHPKRYVEMGARIPKGVLLFGPPGTGKTYLAKAVAGEAGVPFLSISGSDFVEMFVGVGAARVRDLFEQAKKRAPAIVFIDEIDAVGRMRGAGMGGGHDEREQTLNQLLVEMDGFNVNQGIIVMAATNRPDILDPALLRPGRFDRQIVLDKPDLKARKEILKVHSRGKPLAKDVDLETLAKATPGFTPADLENVINEAALLAARHRKRRIGMQEFEEAVQRVVAGPRKKSRIMSEKEKLVIAYHEAGHALVAHKLPNADPVHEVAIISRGGALGYTLQLPTEDRYLVTKSEILDKVTSTLAGRAAEEIIFEEVSTGAANDLEVATRLVRRMIMEFGMSEKLGPLTFGKKEGQVFLGRDLARERDFSEEVAAAIDKEERDIINQCYQKAKQILNENRDTLVLIAETLLEKETIKADELERLIAGKPIEDAGPQPEKAAQDVESSEEIADEGFSKEVQRPGGVRPVPEVQ